MLITLSRRTAICQSVSEVYLTDVAPLGAVSHRFNFNLKRCLYIANADITMTLFRPDNIRGTDTFVERN